ncbi:MAG TPA: aspartate-semialdehyde dehydrogenase [Candidatus Deferrimicrobium sp.]|nr:aspartate-semialdehyde dehydrogenase [Candidatus Deferrimicrobium sp.]
MKKKSCIILGCTGTVGQRLIEALYPHPWFDIVDIAASERSSGQKYQDRIRTEWYLGSDIPEEIAEMVIKPMDPKATEQADLAFSALPADIAKEVEPKFAKAGYILTSNASAFRMAEDVPLIIPEINANHLQLIDVQKKKRGWSGAICTDPNCTTIGLAMVFKPINDRFGIEEAIMNTWQAISGAGLPGVPALLITDNVIPYIGGEEEKVISEVQKILGTFEEDHIKKAGFKMAATCTRVPTIDGHFETAYIKTKERVNIDEVKKVLREFPGLDSLKLPYAPKDPIIVREEINRPQPRLDRMAGSVPGMAVTVGRIRPGLDNKTINLCLISHNTIRGAAGAVILNAELMCAKNYV